MRLSESTVTITLWMFYYVTWIVQESGCTYWSNGVWTWPESLEHETEGLVVEDYALQVTTSVFSVCKLRELQLPPPTCIEVCFSRVWELRSVSASNLRCFWTLSSIRSHPWRWARWARHFSVTARGSVQPMKNKTTVLQIARNTNGKAGGYRWCCQNLICPNSF